MQKLNIKGLKLHKNGRLFGFGVSPNADWKVLFSLFVLLFILISGVSFYMFVKIDKGEIFVVEKQSAVGSRILDTNLLKQTIEYYRERSTRLEEIKANKDATLDPSL